MRKLATIHYKYDYYKIENVIDIIVAK